MFEILRRSFTNQRIACYPKSRSKLVHLHRVIAITLSVISNVGLSNRRVVDSISATTTYALSHALQLVRLPLFVVFFVYAVNARLLD